MRKSGTLVHVYELAEPIAGDRLWRARHTRNQPRVILKRLEPGGRERRAVKTLFARRLSPETDHARVC